LEILVHAKDPADHERVKTFLESSATSEFIERHGTAWPEKEPSAVVANLLRDVPLAVQTV